MRGIAAMFVVSGHATYLVPMEADAAFRMEIQAKTAVAFCFVLSGFVLRQSVRRLQCDGSPLWFDWRDWYRFFGYPLSLAQPLQSYRLAVDSRTWVRGYYAIATTSVLSMLPLLTLLCPTVSLVILLPMSWLSYVYVEQKAPCLGRRFSLAISSFLPRGIPTPSAMQSVPSVLRQCTLEAAF